MHTRRVRHAGRLGASLSRRRRTWAAIVLASLALPATAAAHDDDDGHGAHRAHEPGTATVVHGDPDPGGPAQGTAASAAVDIAIIAADTGWSLDATRRQLADQAAFGDLQDQIESQFPTQFSGAEFAESPGGRSFLRFKGTVPPAAAALASASRLDVGLTGGRRYSATELSDRALAVVKHLAGAGYTNVGAAVLADGTIEVAVTGEPRPAAALPPALRDGVRVTFAVHAVAEDHHTYGGAYIHDTGGGSCTSGFSVESLSGPETGVVTAAHCGGIDHYHQPQTNPTITYDLIWQDQHIGLSGDVEWHTTANDDHVEVAEYYADVTDRREVNSVETSAAVNNTYCLYSRMQAQRTCDQVWSTYVVQITSSGVASNLIGMDDNLSVAGDSGGPWSLSTEAAGIVKGAQWVPFGWHDTWTKAWAFDSAIDVAVMT